MVSVEKSRFTIEVVQNLCQNILMVSVEKMQDLAPKTYKTYYRFDRNASSCSIGRSGTSIVCECVGNVLLLYVFSLKHRPPWQALIIFVKP